MEKPLIIVISPLPLFPMEGGGGARILSYMRYLRQRGFAIELVTVRHEGRYVSAAEAEVDRLWIARPELRKTRLRDRLRHHGRRLPSPVRGVLRTGVQGFERILKPRATEEPVPQHKSNLDRARNTMLDTYAARIIQQRKPCAVITTYAWTTRVFDGISDDVLKIVDTIDIQHLRAALAAAAGFNLDRVTCSAEEEARELRRAQVLLAIQEEEHKGLAQLTPDRSVVLCEHAYPVAETPREAPPVSTNILFVGNHYEPNVDGLRLFLDRAWPAILEAIPTARFHVCGKVCKAVRKAPENVLLHGRVAALEPYYDAASVVINPVPYGTGLKIKTVEALCFGKPLVTTPSGIVGLPETGDLPYIVANVEDMAEPIIALLQDPQARHEWGARALDFARSRFAPEVAYRELEALLWQAANRSTETEPQTLAQEG